MAFLKTTEALASLKAVGVTVARLAKGAPTSPLQSSAALPQVANFTPSAETFRDWQAQAVPAKAE